MEVGKSALNQLLMHPNHALSHQHMDEVHQRKMRALPLRERAQALLHNIDIAPPRIHPLRDVAKDGSTIGIMRIQPPPPGPILIQTRLSAADSSRTEVFAKSREQIRTGCRNHVQTTRV